MAYTACTILPGALFYKLIFCRKSDSRRRNFCAPIHLLTFCRKLDSQGMAKRYQNPARKTERIVKGFANHWRIRILELLSKQPELSLDEIVDELGGNIKTLSVHVQKLAAAGLVMKRSQGRNVRHALTDRGKYVLIFCRKLDSK